MQTQKHNRLIEEIRAGRRPIVVSLYQSEKEIEHTECATIEEARELFARRLADGFQFRLPPWQWFGEDGVRLYDPACLRPAGRPAWRWSSS